MKHLFLLSAVLFITACGSSFSSNSDSVQSGRNEVDEVSSTSKPKAPKRQGWNEIYYPNFYGVDENYPALYGDVASVVVTEYRVKDQYGAVVRDNVQCSKKYYFNADGDVIGRDDYSLDGLLTCRYICKYNSSGKLIEMAPYDSNGSLGWKYIYKYDSSGNMVQMSDRSPEGWSEVKYVYKYDSFGNKIVKLNYDMVENCLIWTSGYKYDELGNLIEETLTGNGCTSLWGAKAIYKYDSLGYKIEQARYDSDNSLLKKFIYKYDSSGNMVEEAEYDSSGKVCGKCTYKYDQKGNVVEQTVYSGDYLAPTSQIEFIITYRNK